MKIDLLNKQIVVDDIQFIRTLKEECVKEGLPYFSEYKVSGEDIMTQCPFHGGGQERKPSFGISTTKNVCHCFACGHSGNIPTMISEIFGYKDWGLYGERWLIKHFETSDIYTRPTVQIESRTKTPEETKVGFTEEELDGYRYTHPYMYKRGLTDEIITEFDIGFDRSTNCVTFPVFNYDGEPAFIAFRSVVGKFFHYPSGVDKPVYAAEKFRNGKFNYCWVVESIFNALTCWRYGIPAVALLGTGTRKQYEILRRMPVRKFVLALDPDPAGRNGANKIFNALKFHKIITFVDVPEGKDINDLGEGVLELVEHL